MRRLRDGVALDAIDARSHLEGPSQYKDAAFARRRELGLVLHREAPERQILAVIRLSELRIIKRPRGKRFRRIP